MLSHHLLIKLLEPLLLKALHLITIIIIAITIVIITSIMISTIIIITKISTLPASSYPAQGLLTAPHHHQLDLPVVHLALPPLPPQLGVLLLLPLRLLQLQTLLPHACLLLGGQASKSHCHIS